MSRNSKLGCREGPDEVLLCNECRGSMWVGSLDVLYKARAPRSPCIIL